MKKLVDIINESLLDNEDKIINKKTVNELAIELVEYLYDYVDNSKNNMFSLGNRIWQICEVLDWRNEGLLYKIYKIIENNSYKMKDWIIDPNYIDSNESWVDVEKYIKRKKDITKNEEDRLANAIRVLLDYRRTYNDWISDGRPLK